MRNKLLIALLTVSFLNFVGCYSYEEITKEEFLNAKESEDLRVTTKNHYTFDFDSGDYIVKKDSIYGNGKLVTAGLMKKDYSDFNGRISLEGIDSFQFDRFDIISTTIAVAIIGLIISAGFSWGSEGGWLHW